MSDGPLVLEVPDLRDDGWHLRPWRVEDAPSLVRAWHDPAIVAGSMPPADRSLDAAERWIAGCDERRLAGVAFDLVIADDADGVVGEFGLSRFDVDRAAAMAGWWIHEEARARGLGGSVVTAATEWLLTQGLRAVLAEIDPGNHASVAVARRAGYARLGNARVSNARLGNASGGSGDLQVWAARSPVG